MTRPKSRPNPHRRHCHHQYLYIREDTRSICALPLSECIYRFPVFGCSCGTSSSGRGSPGLGLVLAGNRLIREIVDEMYCNYVF